MEDVQPGFILGELLYVPGGLVHHHPPLLGPDGLLQPALHLGGLVAGVVPALHVDALLVVRPELFQLLGGVLGAVDPQDDGEGGVAAVERSDMAAERVVQRLVGGVGVLLPGTAPGR